MEKRLLARLLRRSYSSCSNQLNRSNLIGSQQQTLYVNLCGRNKKIPVGTSIDFQLSHQSGCRRYNSSIRGEARIKISSSSLEQVKHKSQSLLETKVGSLNQASILELNEAIASWHSEAMSNPDKIQYDMAEALMNRLLDEQIYGVTNCDETNEENSIVISTELINRVLDTWRIFSNAQTPSKSQRKRSTSLLDEESFVHRGPRLLQRIKEAEEQLNKSESKHTIQFPDDKSYNMLLDGYAKYGSTHEAMALFEEMQEIVREGRNSQCRPGVISYNTLLAAFANTTSDHTSSAEKAKHILEDMLALYSETGNPDVKPDLITFSTVLSACANASAISPSFAEDAENILYNMIEMYNSEDGEWINLQPNEVCFTSVINAWSRSDVSDAEDRATRILTEMQSSNNDEDIQREATTAMIGAFSNSEGIDGSEKAEHLLNRMIDLAQESGKIESMPSSITFLSFLDCLAQSAARSVSGDNGVAAMKAEGIIHRMEEMARNESYGLKPDVSIYNALINCWAKSQRKDAGQKAEAWLKRIESMYASSGNDNLKPDSITYSTVIQAYANIGDGSSAERVLMEMIEICKHDSSLRSDNSIAFATTINAYANAGNPREAERILSLRQKMHKDGFIDIDPNDDTFIYNPIINAYLKSNEKGQIKICLRLLEEMRVKCIANTVSYGAVIEGLSKVQQPWAEKKAEQLLVQMWSSFNSGENVKAKPTSVIYNSIINVFAKSRNLKMKEKAKDYLLELEKKYEETKDPLLRPTTVSYNITLSSLSKATKPEDAEEAEALLNRMQEIAASKYFWVKPDSFSMTNVISAWANSSADGGAERAESIFNHMQTMYEEGNSTMKPTTVAFGAVLHAWAKKGNSARAEAIVSNMESLMNTKGFEELRPNAVIYNSLINAYSRDREANAIQKVGRIITKMKSLRDEGFVDAAPTRITYNSILSVYARSIRQDASVYNDARNLLKEMEMLKKTDPGLAPNVVTYTTFLNVLARANSQNKAKIAEAILNLMHNGDNHHLYPNNFAYDAALRVCANVNTNDSNLRGHALLLAIKILTDIKNSDKVSPTSFTYAAFFSAIKKLAPSSTEYSNMLEKAFPDCCERGLLEQKTLSNLCRDAPLQLMSKLLNTKMHPRETRIGDLPQGWSINSKKKNLENFNQRYTERSVHKTGRQRIR